jgi:ABC-type glutathione transport system ATPase component
LEISVENGVEGRGPAVVRETSLRRVDQGVVLSWEDLWVSADGGKTGRVPILCGVNGYARSGEVLAIMGPSGCGKSTLLDSLAGITCTDARESYDIILVGTGLPVSFPDKLTEIFLLAS